MVGDTAQLGNARVDIPITLPDRWKRVAAVTAHLKQHSQIKGAHQNNHKSNRMAYEEMRPIKCATLLVRQSLMF